LEIEIQFYLIAPLLFRILSFSKITRRLILSGLCVLFITLQHYFPTETITIYLHIQYFLAGILLADFYTSGDFREAANNGIVKIAGALLLVAILFVPFKEAFWAALVFPFIVGAFYLIILRNNAIKKIFSFGFLPIIGGMCYSIYLLHYPIVSMAGRFTMRLKFGNSFLPNLFIQIVVISIVILAISSVFYALIERPFMSSKWTDKLMGKNKKEDTINPVAVPEVAEPLENK
jgi:peptidoglycan/LPS O-acetylase OafA/YrhL